MNEMDTSMVLEDPALDQASSEGAADLPLFVGDEVAVMEVSASDRPFLTTSLNDYSVTEGLLLMIVLLMLVSGVLKLLKGAFSWL